MDVLLSSDRGHTPTRLFSAGELEASALQERFENITGSDQVTWPITYRMIRPLGAGGQGIVFLADRLNPHDLSFRLALKFHRPDIYPDITTYRSDMARVAHVANELAQIQQDHLLDIFNFVETDGIHVMVMEWIDGIDLAHLLRPGVMERIRRALIRMAGTMSTMSSSPPRHNSCGSSRGWPTRSSGNASPGWQVCIDAGSFMRT